MLTEDDEPRSRPKFTPLPLDRLGVEELEAYIEELRGEIARVEAEMARKKHLRSAADSFFKLP